MLQDVELRTEQGAGYLLVDGRVADPRSLADLYREFAVFCISRDIESALVRVGPEEYGYLAMRDAFTMMLLAGLPAGFKVAFVTGPLPARGRLEKLRQDLERLRITAAIFAEEGAAEAWLGSDFSVAQLNAA